MSYIVPIHRPTAVRKALKLSFLSPNEDTLVVAYVPHPFRLANADHVPAKRIAWSFILLPRKVMLFVAA